MCTLTIRFDPDAETPVVVAANRDELYRRASLPPSVITGRPAVFAPRDREAGGTWLGVNENGLFASITNVWIQHGKSRYQGEPGTRSRGLLTLDVLRCIDLQEAATTIRRLLHQDTYQFFNLAVVSPTGGAVFTHTGALKQYPISPGVTTVLNAPYDPRRDRGDSLPPYEPGGISRSKSKDSWLKEVRAYLSQHPEICKHGKTYGTRCSHIVTISQRGDHRFWYSDGHPCQTEFQDMSGDPQGMSSGVHTPSNY